MSQPPTRVVTIAGTLLAVEGLLEQFESAWKSDSPPKIEEYLHRIPAAGTAQDAFQRRHLLEELIKLDLHYSWERRSLEGIPGLPGETGGPRLEEYLHRFPELGPLNLLSDGLITAEYLVRHCCGDRPAVEEYLARFPDRRDRLKTALARVDAEIISTGPRSKPENGAIARPVGEPSFSVPEIVERALRLGLVRKSQVGELTALQHSCTDPGILLRELVQRNCLTEYQATQLVSGDTSNLVLGPYVVLDSLGKGGTGCVFKARHRHLDRLVAIKVLRPELLTEPEVTGRFLREVRLISQLAHPHIIHAFDAGPVDNVFALIMEFVPGVDLGKLVQGSGPLQVDQASEYIRQAALGLQHIAERELVHRDIKPSNLLLTQAAGTDSHGVVKILDLGLARMSIVQNATPGTEGTMHLTPVGSVMMGTPDYMAPEQAMDFHRADIRADIYSLGCTLCYLLTGQPPFPSNTLAEKLIRHQQAEPPSLRAIRPDVPERLDFILRKMLAKLPEQRFLSPADVADALTSTSPIILSSAITEIPPEIPAERTTGVPLSEVPVAVPAVVRSSRPPVGAAHLVVWTVLVAVIAALVSAAVVLSLPGRSTSLAVLPSVRTPVLPPPGAPPSSGKDKTPVSILNPSPSNPVATQPATFPTPPATFPSLVPFLGCQFRQTKDDKGSFSFNGTAKPIGDKVHLTTAESDKAQVGSFFSLRKLPIGKFQNHFVLLITKADAKADGIAFVIQGVGPTAIGEGGRGLGYEGIPKSIAIKFDIFDDEGEGTNSTGLYINGEKPTVRDAIKLDPKIVNLKWSTDAVDMKYDGKVLEVKIMNSAQRERCLAQSYKVDIPRIVGGDQAYVGFTASSREKMPTGHLVFSFAFTPK